MCILQFKHAQLSIINDFFLQPTAVLSAEALINIGNKGKSNYLWLNYKFRVVPRISNTQNICSLLNFRGL